MILSNTDNDSIVATISGPLKGIEFDDVYTAQNMGSYKPSLSNFKYLLEGVKRDIGVACIAYGAESKPWRRLREKWRLRGNSRV